MGSLYNPALDPVVMALASAQRRVKTLQRHNAHAASRAKGIGLKQGRKQGAAVGGAVGAAAVTPVAVAVDRKFRKSAVGVWEHGPGASLAELSKAFFRPRRTPPMTRVSLRETKARWAAEAAKKQKPGRTARKTAEITGANADEVSRALQGSLRDVDRSVRRGAIAGGAALAGAATVPIVANHSLARYRERKRFEESGSSGIANGKG
jgi:hypothetical protein